MGVNFSIISKLNSCKYKFKSCRKESECCDNKWFPQIKNKINNFLYKRRYDPNNKKSDDVIIDINDIKSTEQDYITTETTNNSLNYDKKYINRIADINLNEIKSPNIYKTVYSEHISSSFYQNQLRSPQKYSLHSSNNSYSAYNYPSINAVKTCNNMYNEPNYTSCTTSTSSISSARSFTYGTNCNKIIVTAEAHNDPYFNIVSQSKNLSNTTTSICGITSSKPITATKNAVADKYKIKDEKNVTFENNNTEFKKVVKKEDKVVTNTIQHKLDDNIIPENIISSDNEMKDVDLTHSIIAELSKTYDTENDSPNDVENSQDSCVLKDFSTSDDETDNTDDYIHINYPK